MKHFACFNVSKGLTSLKLFIAMALLATSCSKHDEIDFKGTIIDTRECTLSYVRPDLGYLVQLSSPENYGTTYTSQYGETYNNVVILYDPDCLLYLHDQIKGAFYRDDEYPRSKCSLHWNDLDNIPVGVFTAVTVD